MTRASSRSCRSSAFLISMLQQYSDAMKLALTMVGAGIFWRLRHRADAELGVWAVTVAYVLLAIRWADYTLVAPPLGP